MRVSLSTAARAAAVGVAAIRFGRGARRAPALVSRPRELRGRTVSVVIPARNEGDRLGPCLASLRGRRFDAESAPTEFEFEIIVVDDGSTDDTVEVAHRHGATVIQAGSLPHGWAGKANALQRGIEAASTEVVITLDADTRAEPGLVGSLVDALGADLLITAGAATAAGASEAPVHGSMLATLLYRLGPPGTDGGSTSRVMANGQCMVMDRDRFLARGGLAPVAASLTEDVALARHLARDGESVRFVDATALVTVEGYGSGALVWNGWGRSIALSEVTPPIWQAADLAVLWLALAFPLPRVVSGRGDAIDTAALVLRAGVAVALAPAYRHRPATYWLTPLADAAVVARLTWSTVRPNRTWRGRTYPVGAFKR